MVLGTWRQFALPFLVWLTCLVPTELHAQTCTLKPALPTTMVDAAPATRFLPSGREGQILVKSKYSSSSVAAVSVTSGTEPAKWKVLSEAAVMSIKAAPEKTADGKAYEGFSSADSSIVRFLVPETESFWENRTFAVRVCDPDGDVLAIVNARVSTPAWAKLISAGVIVLFYLGFALAVSTARGQPHPLVTKYPAFANRQIYGWLKTLDPIILTADAFNRGSVQKLQVLLFSFLVSGMVLSLVLTEGILSDLSETVALLLGISAVGAAVAKKATESRERLGFENWAWLVKKNVLPINEAHPDPRWADLVVTNGEFDVYKLQTLIFSLVVGVALLTAGEERLASFAVPQTLLGILGLSQIVYVAGKLAAPPSIADLDDAITRLRGFESKLQTAVARNIDTDGDGKLIEPLPPSPVPLPSLGTRTANAANAMRLYAKQADQVEVMLESTLSVVVDRTKLDPTLS